VTPLFEACSASPISISENNCQRLLKQADVPGLELPVLCLQVRVIEAEVTADDESLLRKIQALTQAIGIMSPGPFIALGGGRCQAGNQQQSEASAESGWRHRVF